jgi:protease-4
VARLTEAAVAVRKGVWLVLVLVAVAVVVSAAALLAVVLMVGGAPSIPRQATLVLRLDQPLAEADPRGVLQPFFEPPLTVRTVVDGLARAARDPRIAGVVVVPAAPPGLWAKTQEVREAILAFRRSGKPTVAFLEYGGQQEYYLASACDKVFLAPTSPLDLTGLATYEVFVRGLLDKLGIEPDLVHTGEYKTAANTFTETTFTPAHREMAESLNRDLYEQMLAGLAEARGKSTEEVRALVDGGPLLAEAALEAGLVDGLAYLDEVPARVGLRDDAAHRVRFEEYRRAAGARGRGPRVAVIHIEGPIATGRSLPGGAATGSETVARYLARAREDRAVRAVVLRIDSPGGSAVAADLIWHEVARTRAVKPVVASMSDVAASGGYYVALPADAIVADAGTLTGSIGVVAGKFAIGGALRTIGVNIETVADGRYALLASPTRPFTPDERAKLTALVEATYAAFVRKAADGRRLPVEQIDAVAQGRVWTGRQARAVGLVDELGGFARALALAKTRAGLDPEAPVDLVVYPPRRSVFELLLNPFGEAADVPGWGALRWPARALDPVVAPLVLFRPAEPLALMPALFVR